MPTNRETFSQPFQIFDENGEAVDLTGCDITFELRDPATRCVVLSATTDNAGAVIDTTTFTITFTADQMRTLCPKQYDVGCTITCNDTTASVMATTLSITDGVVR